MSDGDPPPIEIIERGGEAPPPDPPRGWRLGRWQEAPFASALTTGLLVIALVLTALVVTQDDRGDGPNPLQRWAAEQHRGAPPPGFDVPVATCDDDPHDFVAVRRCVQRGDADRRRVVGHFRIEFSFPDAVDHWIEVRSDGSATIVERWVSPEPRPDVGGLGAVRSADLRLVRTTWRQTECEALAFSSEPDVYPGVQCEAPLGDEPAFDEEIRFRPTTDDERRDLIRAFACTFPDELDDVEC